MYELVRCGEMSFYLDAPVKSGIVLSGAGDIVLIDSGGDKDAGKKILKILESNGWRLSFIVNTHSNADHIGGNAFLQKRTGCRIFGSGMENAFIRFPVLEPSFLFGGFPCRELRNKFLTASESVPEDISGAPLPPGTEILPLKGHFFDMIGLKTPDGICFAADALFSENVLRKYGTPFIYDVRAFLETLDMFEGLEARLFVPAHAEAVEDIRPLVGANRRKVNETAEKYRKSAVRRVLPKMCSNLFLTLTACPWISIRMFWSAARFVLIFPFCMTMGGSGHFLKGTACSGKPSESSSARQKKKAPGGGFFLHQILRNILNRRLSPTANRAASAMPLKLAEQI